VFIQALQVLTQQQQHRSRNRLPNLHQLQGTVPAT